METSDTLSNLEDINTLFSSANTTKFKISERNHMLAQACILYYRYIKNNCEDNSNKPIEQKNIPIIETNIDTTPENFAMCTSELNTANTKLQTCLNNNQEIIRESNNATQLQMFENQKFQMEENYITLFTHFEQIYNEYNILKANFEKLSIEYNKLNEQMHNENQNYEQYKNELKQDFDALELQNSNYKTQNIELQNEYDNGKEMNKTLREQNLELKQIIENQGKDIITLQTYCNNFNNQNNYASEQLANDVSLEKIQLYECEAKNQELKNENEMYKKNYKTIATNQKAIMDQQRQEYTDYHYTTESLSQILEQIKGRNSLIAQIQNSEKNPDQIKCLPAQPYELKMYLYNTVTHALFNVNDLIKSVDLYGKNNIQYALRNRRFDGASYKNSIRIYSNESVENLLKYDQMSKYLEDNL